VTRSTDDEFPAPSSQRARAIVVLARAPSVPGKTRLTANLRDDDARALREALLLDTLEVVRSVNVPVTLAYTPDNARAEMEAYVDRGPWTVGRGPWASLRPQRGDDLGARMHCALTDAFAAGATQVLLIGSDLPTLPPTHLGDAFGVLESIDCVFGPADDGGYYLIGVRRGVDLSRIVTGVRWGTARVLEETLSAARAVGVTTKLVNGWFDVDLPEDLRRVASDARLAEKRREFYRRFLR
jgi:hypothetical protein